MAEGTEYQRGDVHVSEDEGFCVEAFPHIPASKGTQHSTFCKMFRVEPTVKAVIGAKSSHDFSPSKAYEDQPKLNVPFAVNSVIRILRSNRDGSCEFGSGWLASPPIVCLDGTTKFYVVTAAHVVKDKPNGEQATQFRGCFGRLVDRDDFFTSVAFEIEPNPIFMVHDNDGDIAVMKFSVTEKERLQSIPDTVSYLLPASPVAFGKAGLGAFGYPGADSFLLKCQKELLMGGKGEYEIWDKYGSLFNTKVELYNAITWAAKGIHTGDLICSPTTLMYMVGNCGYVRSSSLPGSSGSPVMSNMAEAEGYACFTLRGCEGKGKDLLNMATSHDHPEFVSFYGERILPLIPPHMEGRLARPFKEWCSTHGLIPSNQSSEEEVTPPATVWQSFTFDFKGPE